MVEKYTLKMSLSNQISLTGRPNEPELRVPIRPVLIPRAHARASFRPDPIRPILRAESQNTQNVPRKHHDGRFTSRTTFLLFRNPITTTTVEIIQTQQTAYSFKRWAWLSRIIMCRPHQPAKCLTQSLPPTTYHKPYGPMQSSLGLPRLSTTLTHFANISTLR